MKKFIRKFFIILGILMLCLLVALIGGAIWGFNFLNQQNNIQEDSILEIKFSEDIPEKSIEVSTAESLALGTTTPVSLRECLELIQHAQRDDRIKGISIIGNAYIRHSKSLEISRAIQQFKESGKPIFAYGDHYSQSGYAMASHADSLFINPNGYLDLKGYVIIMPFLKDFLKKYSIEMEVFVAGKYKSYVEMYTRNEASDANREQYTRYLEFLVESLAQHISKARSIPYKEVHEIIHSNLAYNSDYSKQYQLIDVIAHKTDYYQYLEDRLGIKEKNVISLRRYKKYRDFKKKHKKANVAYVVVDGNITTNEGNASARLLRKSFKSIRDDNEIKTILLRINSPGGSAFASEEIWHEIELCKNQGIDVISSVSSISASGGYYTMCNSDKIFSTPSSVTGSIGVFIAFPVFNKALKDNFDIHFDEIETGPFARRNTGMVALTDPQKEMYKTITEELYDRFLGRVAEGRHMTKKEVAVIAQGRIYTGHDALKINLVDSLLYLDQVFDYIQEKHDLDELVLKEYPEIKKEIIPTADKLFSAKMNTPKEWNNIIKENSENLELFLMSGEPIARMPIYEIQD